jgi:hypothetical protein
MISIKKTASYTASDNTPHPTREAAIAHETLLQRKARLKEFFDKDGALFEQNNVDYLAEKGDAIIAALSVKQTRGPRKPKVTPAAGTAATV